MKDNETTTIYQHLRHLMTFVAFAFCFALFWFWLLPISASRKMPPRVWLRPVFQENRCEFRRDELQVAGVVTFGNSSLP